MPENEHLLSLLSIEVLVSQVQIDLNVECHLPCLVFRLLDYPAVSIPYFDAWQIEEFHQFKRDYPKASWRQLLSDQFYELRSANGKFNFSRGKSCLFKTYFKTLYTHLLNVPLFILLIDQINDQGKNDQTTHFIGSCNVKLNELIELLNQAIIRNGNDIPLVEQQTFHCTLFNLMGTPIGTCDLAVRFCQYGTTILTQLPMLDDTVLTKAEKPAEVAKPVVPTPAAAPPPPPPAVADTIVKHIHFVNEKRDVGLQLSRSDLPSSSNHSKSAQTRWTSTKTDRSEYHHSKSRYLRTIEDPSLDDPSTASYRPPPLYFNAHSDFLQMITPATSNYAGEAKENRLSYLASIPIEEIPSDHSSDDDDENHLKHQRKTKSAQNVRFNLASASTNVPRAKPMPKPQALANDFLQNFPLLRSLVEEALALQNQQNGSSTPLPGMVFSGRPRSAVQQGPPRPRSMQTKSVIIARKQNANPRRLYPSPPQTRLMMVTKNEVRSLVDRLSKPKFNKRIEREIALPEPPVTPRLPPKPTSAPTTGTNKGVTAHKPPLSYGTTRAHRLYAEYARARRAAQGPQPATSPKSQRSPRKESPSNGRIPPLSPQLINTGTLSHFSLLNKVDIDTATMEKNSLHQASSERREENTSTNIKSSSTTSQDVTLELNQRSSSSSPTPSPTMPEHVQPNNQTNELGFSIADVTDYFTDGGNGSSTRPSTRQSP